MKLLYKYLPIYLSILSDACFTKTISGCSLSEQRIAARHSDSGNGKTWVQILTSWLHSLEQVTYLSEAQQEGKRETSYLALSLFALSSL